MSTFVDHLVGELAEKAIPSASRGLVQFDTKVDDTQQKQTLRFILTSLNPPTSVKTLEECFNHKLDTFFVPSRSSDKEKETLQKAVLGRMIVAVYVAALRTYLAEATEAESEAEWWYNIERSRKNLAWYFLQSRWQIV
jgi:nuclear control of ATPase protein 2